MDLLYLNVAYIFLCFFVILLCCMFCRQHVFMQNVSPDKPLELLKGFAATFLGPLELLKGSAATFLGPLELLKGTAATFLGPLEFLKGFAATF